MLYSVELRNLRMTYNHYKLAKVIPAGFKPTTF